MFTGLIEDVGALVRVTPQGNGARLTIRTRLPLAEVSLGDSIAVCGACLTVTRLDGASFDADISRETVARTAFSSLPPGAPLHLERAMRLGDRLDGHLVMGHVDGQGTLRRWEERGDSLYLGVDVPPGLLRYCVEKGSIAVHGVSLTINELLESGVGLTLVPWSRKKTCFDQLRPGALLHVEVDVIGKYVERLLGTPKHESHGGREDAREDGKHAGLSMAMLEQHGFLR